MAPTTPKAPKVSMRRSVGVRRASQKPGYRGPEDLPAALSGGLLDCLAGEQGGRDAADADGTLGDVTALGTLSARPIPLHQVGEPTRIDPDGLTRGGGYWVGHHTATGQRVEAVGENSVYPCKCDISRSKSYGRGCSRKWCECSGRPITPGSREDEQLPADCCARHENSVARLRAEQDQNEIDKRALQRENEQKASRLAAACGSQPGRVGYADAGQDADVGQGKNPAGGRSAARGVAAMPTVGDVPALDGVAVTTGYLSQSEPKRGIGETETETETETATRADYEGALAAARTRLANDACHCPTPWDQAARNASTGLHCVGCHENFQTIMAYELHRPTNVMGVCKEPGAIVDDRAWGGSGRRLLSLGQKNGMPAWSVAPTGAVVAPVKMVGYGSKSKPRRT